MAAGGRRRAASGAAARAGAVAVLVAGTLAILGVYLYRAVRTETRLAAPTLARQYASNLAQFHCLTGEVHADVARSSKVFVGRGYDGQVLGELVAGWADPAPESRAAWQLTLLPAGPCGGERVEARRL